MGYRSVGELGLRISCILEFEQGLRKPVYTDIFQLLPTRQIEGRLSEVH